MNSAAIVEKEQIDGYLGTGLHRNLHTSGRAILELPESILRGPYLPIDCTYHRTYHASWAFQPAMIGKLVSHYRVLEKIGAGGMGEVFRARDERLERNVALKIVQPTSNPSSDHLRRFEQEARAAAALNHPNIVAIYDIGFENGVPYIVSELLEGETLRQRLSEGLLSIAEVLDYSSQMIQGLIAAHDHRIVHRDLKPEICFSHTMAGSRFLILE